MDKLYQDGTKCPQIENLTKITPEQAAEYVRFVAHVRHTQRRYFTFRKPEILEESRRLEKALAAGTVRWNPAIEDKTRLFRKI